MQLILPNEVWDSFFWGKIWRKGDLPTKAEGRGLDKKALLLLFVAQSCLTLCSPMDCSLLGSSVHGISQVKILEWVAISFSRASFWPRNRIQSLTSPALAGSFFTTSVTWEVQYYPYNGLLFSLKKKWSLERCYSVDESWGHYNSSEPVTKG